jgi:hypothetical protein
MVRKYKIISAEHASSDKAQDGDIVYDLGHHDYGCASDDTRYTGMEFVSVTYEPTGQYPFFTIPKEALQQVSE